MATLPKPRELLTSLINSISDIPLFEQPPPADDATSSRGGAGAADRQPQHPLKAVPPSHRCFLITLHVLLPTLLLPALDLLDRGLVTRLIPSVKTVKNAKARSTGAQEAGQEGTDPEPVERPFRPSPPYLVRSAQQPTQSRRRYDATAGVGSSSAPGTSAYLVRLGSWNCTCAAFAFTAFPPSCVEAGYDTDAGLDSETGPLRPGLENPGPEWSFGGASFDGTQGSSNDGVPCCKHLLACLLAERWHVALGPYVVERKVEPEEMAGIVADV